MQSVLVAFLAISVASRAPPGPYRCSQLPLTQRVRDLSFSRRERAEGGRKSVARAVEKQWTEAGEQMRKLTMECLQKAALRAAQRYKGKKKGRGDFGGRADVLERVEGVRIAEKQDMLWMKHLNEKYLPENYPVEFWKSTLIAWPGLSYVYESDGEILGYVLGKMDISYKALPNQNQTFKNLKMLNEGKILSICVRHDKRGMGIGKKLLDAVVQAMLHDYEADFLSLRVRENTNPNAVRLYTKSDFQISEIVRSYYRDGENALLMLLHPKNTPQTQSRTHSASTREDESVGEEAKLAPGFLR
mmetsp:Transcript_24751/g.39065  ORF Transcript_24751/g.39065 Transcript_24751/m.39065 type:complete len:302 (-) Transcript_24751:115-1020(-)